MKIPKIIQIAGTLFAIAAMILPVGAVAAQTETPGVQEVVQGDTVMMENADAAAVSAYWTPERLASAKPMDLMVMEGEPDLALMGNAEEASGEFTFVAPGAAIASDAQAKKTFASAWKAKAIDSGAIFPELEASLEPASAAYPEIYNNYLLISINLCRRSIRTGG